MNNTKVTKEELRKFVNWLNEQKSECTVCYNDCPAYINGAYGGDCVLSQASEYIEMIIQKS